LERFMARLVPDGDPLFEHDAEGPDDMPAHVRSVLTSSDLCLPIRDGRLALGTWQGVYLWEHRTAPHERRVLVTLHGEGAGDGVLPYRRPPPAAPVAQLARAAVSYTVGHGFESCPGHHFPRVLPGSQRLSKWLRARCAKWLLWAFPRKP